MNTTVPTVPIVPPDSYRDVPNVPSEKAGGAYLDMELLRFTTAGSVDDGKSTLIGRLLYDSKSIFEDQMEAVKAASERLGGEGEVNLALLTDGLRAEREQGITIDVAYRYFATPRRKFIIADTPGHIEYTRNMVTGASTADAAVILVDARNGIIEQTKRHSYIASLLQLPNVIVAVNKMDLVEFSEDVFNAIKEEYEEIARKLQLKKVHYLPISAKLGDNVVERSTHTPWYKGEPLLHLLETIDPSPSHTPLTEESSLPVNDSVTQSSPPLRGDLGGLSRFPVQYVIRPHRDEYHDYRAYAGRIASGTFRVGDRVTVLPSFTESRIKAIDFADKELAQATAPQSVSIRLEDNVDVSRGDMLVPSDNLPHLDTNISLLVCWLNHRPLSIGAKYIIRHTTDEVFGIIRDVYFKVNINTLENIIGDKTVKMNDIAHLQIKTSRPLKYDLYAQNRITGSLVLIDESTYETVGAGMIVQGLEEQSYAI